MERTAIVKGHNVTQERVAAYLPHDYKVISEHPSGVVIIQGRDVAGWTLDDYVIPRLASGLLFAREIREEV